MIENFENFLFDLMSDLKLKIRFSHNDEEKEYALKQLEYIEDLIAKHKLEELV